MPRADVVLLGEVHDNPAHHAFQAEAVAHLAPRALVFEMLTPDQAANADLSLGPAELSAALGWAASGWPDFAMYYPIFEAAPETAIYGAAVSGVRAAFEVGAAEVFGAGAAAYGLTQPLPPSQQTAREALQAEAHCDALPPEMLPGMVEVQRLRDAALARAAIEAHGATGGPVAVILGSGHARTDWGVPAMLAMAAPDLRVVAVGQVEGPSAVPFDHVVTADPPERDDPCAAFQKS